MYSHPIYKVPRISSKLDESRWAPVLRRLLLPIDPLNNATTICSNTRFLFSTANILVSKASSSSPHGGKLRARRRVGMVSVDGSIGESLPNEFRAPVTVDGEGGSTRNTGDDVLIESLHIFRRVGRSADPNISFVKVFMAFEDGGLAEICGVATSARYPPFSLRRFGACSNLKPVCNPTC